MRALSILLFLCIPTLSLAQSKGNRLAYLDDFDPYYPSHTFPKLTTPMWIGDKETEAVIILGIDDMRETKKYELFLRPILNRLKKIDGRAPLSIMTCQVDPKDPQLQTWLKEGVSIECHTIAHPCPFFKIGFEKAKKTYDDCIDLMCEIPNNKPVAYRMPCCDSLNTPSPRHWAEIFNKTTSPAPPSEGGEKRGGNFLQIDTSVFNVFTSADPELPKNLVLNDKGEERFKRYLPKDRTFVNTIENYPYPYVIGKLCWEFPCVTPSDWSAQHLQGKNNPDTVADWKRAIDCTVIKQGVFCLVFHPHGWIKNDQVVEMIDYVQEKYGKKVKFLNFGEASTYLTANHMKGKSLREQPPAAKVSAEEKMPLPPGARRAENGKDNGLRFVDLDADGKLDIVFSNEKEYGIYLFENMEKGWSRKVLAGKRGEQDASKELPMISRNGTNNGFFVHSGFLWWANEDTVLLKDHVDRRSIKELLNPPQAQGQRPLGNENDIPRPLSPEESLKCLKPRPGFKVELMAAEPLVMDPIAFAWGPDGKFWVVEMGDYPLGTDGKNKFGGKIKILTKSKGGDGPYDTAVTFMDNLGYPTGVMPWGKGVLVSCAPDIFYAEDTDGDGKADKKVVLFTGFGEGNQQHRVNGFTYGLDNWIHGANGDSGGKIRAVNTLTPPAPPSKGGEKTAGSPPSEGGAGGVDIRGRDFRFKVDGSFEAQSGQSQFGRHRDDWGNWFGNNNSNPMWHYVLDDRYQSRNKHLPSPDPRVPVSVKPGAAPVFPISKPLPRFNSPNALNHFTSACSAIVYRDDLFGPEFKDNTFVSEPVHNLVHREVMKPKGITFTSQRASDEQTSEFLASTDNWFRPAMIQTGPDGALWVADMYRYVIEHPQWIPIDWQKKLDLRAGHDKGRVYRVYPENKKPRTIPRLDKLSTAELVAALDSPSGWQRDMAQQILISKKDSQARSPLTELLKSGNNPPARLHALCTLADLGDLSADIGAWQRHVELGLRDPHPGVRRHAIRVSEHLIPNWNISQLAGLIGDADPQVRLQLAYTFGELGVHSGAPELGDLMARHADDKYFRAAALSSVNPVIFDKVVQGAMKSPTPSAELLESLLRLAALYDASESAERILSACLDQQREAATRFELVANLLDAFDSRRPTGIGEASLKKIERAIAAARSSATSVKAPVVERVAALRLVGRAQKPTADDVATLAAFLSPQAAEELQSAAIGALSKLRDPSVSDLLLKSWRGLLPTQRNQVVDVFLSRQDLLAAALTALEKKQIAPLEIDATRRQQLLDHKNLLVRTRARKIFAGTVDADRAKVIEAHRPVISMKGDAASGAKVFSKSCSACHQLAGVGQQVGPDLASVKDKTPEGLLIAMLDPNRAVEARYVNYSAVTKAGLTYSGLLASETGTSITLVGVDGKKHTVLRTDIDELYSTGKSVMPDGLEKDLSHKDMADLIAFLRQNLPAVGRKTFVGNDPNWVRNTQDGTLHLTAKNCEIYGSTLVFEGQYSNLGYWSSADDKAVWQLELSRPGKYAVWLDWACDASSAGNGFVLQVVDQKVTGKVESTGGWENYRQTKIGEITLEVGRQEFVMQAVGPIRGALMDLREIKLVPVK